MCVNGARVESRLRFFCSNRNSLVILSLIHWAVLSCFFQLRIRQNVGDIQFIWLCHWHHIYEWAGSIIRLMLNCYRQFHFAPFNPINGCALAQSNWNKCTTNILISHWNWSLRFLWYVLSFEACVFLAQLCTNCYAKRHPSDVPHSVRRKLIKTHAVMCTIIITYNFLNEPKIID